jgi:S-adenosylmethionine/arginine decarboxylase-like enzyme
MTKWHLFARVEVRRPLLAPARADAFMRQAVAAAGMNVIGGPFSVLGAVPGNEGVSSTVLLDFSSANLHEWPAHHPWPMIHFDLFTCGARPMVRQFFELFRELEPAAFDCKIVDRDQLLGPRNPF